MKNPALVCSAIALLAPLAAAQFPSRGGSPLVTPPQPHPTQAVTPLVDTTMPRRPPAADPTRGAPAAPTAPPGGMPGCAPQPAADPDTVGVKLSGKQLRRAVASVEALPWHDDLLDARAQSAATGKPVLWLQALGDIDGFA